MKFRAAAAAVAAVPLALGLVACAAPQEAAPVAHLNRVTFVPAMDSAITKQKSWRVTGKMTANGTTLLTMDGVQTTQPTMMSMKMSGETFDGETAEVVLIGSTAYVSLPGTTPSGKFVEVDAATDPEFAELLDSGDPTKIYKSIGGAVRNVTFVRTEAVKRQMLDKYEVLVDMAKVSAAQGKQLPAGAPEAMTYQMWLDKAHLVRKLEFNLSGVNMVMSMTDYNEPVKITAPPASKIVSR